MRRAPVFAISFTIVTSLAATIASGCSSSSSDPSTTPSSGDASVDGATPASDAGTSADAGVDANCPKPKPAMASGQTCIGFGAGSPCDSACGLPAYGYVCFNGGPPNLTGCVQASATSSFGDTYCCPKNDCVTQPDQDSMCNAGKPHRVQCPPDTSGNPVAPPAGCGDGGTGATSVEKYYCCP